MRLRVDLTLLATTSIFLLLFIAPLDARVLRVEIVSRAEVLNGKAFGSAGAYERVAGRIYFSVTVSNPHDQSILDLANAENLKNGEVQFSADFVAFRPKDGSKGNGAMLLEIPNRGHARILSLVDGGEVDAKNDAGDGWLLSNGFTVVSLGWQWDAAGDDSLKLLAPTAGGDVLKLFPPIARDHGQTITGLLRGDIMPSKVMLEIPLGHYMLGNIGGTEYAVAAPDDPRNTLTVRDSRSASRREIPRAEWRFAREVDGKLVASDRSIHLNGGFQPGKIYEYVYVVANPVVAGLGFAAVRDFASYVKHAPDAVVAAQRVYGEGISQNGRFLRDFLYQGFNATRRGAMRSMACWRMLRARGGEASTIVSRSPRAMRSRRRRCFFRRIFFLSPISRRPTRRREKRAGFLIVRRATKFCLRFFSRIHRMSIGGGRRR